MSDAFIGRKSAIWLWIETTRWTAVAPVVWLPKTAWVLNQQQNQQQMILDMVWLMKCMILSQRKTFLDWILNESWKMIQFDIYWDLHCENTHNWKLSNEQFLDEHQQDETLFLDEHWEK